MRMCVIRMKGGETEGGIKRERDREHSMGKKCRDKSNKSHTVQAYIRRCHPAGT